MDSEAVNGQFGEPTRKKERIEELEEGLWILVSSRFSSDSMQINTWNSVPLTKIVTFS